MSPSFQIDSNAPVTIPSKPKPWVVNNDEGSGHGMMSLESATWSSVNAVYARVAWAVGIKNVANTAKKMGIQTPLPNYASLALGSVNCTPYEMASAYSALANDGVHYDPIVITKVLDHNGQTVPSRPSQKGHRWCPGPSHAWRPRSSRESSDRELRPVPIGRPAAGKTGTSQLQSRPAWFIGYTPQLVTSVWVGFPMEKTIDRGWRTRVSAEHSPHLFGRPL